MESIGKIVPQIISTPSWPQRLKAAKILSRWSEIVGENLAKFTKPRGFSRGALILEVKDSSWMHQLKFEEGHLLKRLNQEAGEPLFSSLRLVLSQGGFSSSPPSFFLPEPDSKLLKQVARDIAPIQDPELREAFARLRLTLLLKAQRAVQLRRYKRPLGFRK